MPDISSIGPMAGYAVGAARPSTDAEHHASSRAAGVNGQPGADVRDHVELSRHALLLDELRRLPNVRQNLVDKVRSAIATNRYETPERLDATINALLAELNEDHLG